MLFSSSLNSVYVLVSCLLQQPHHWSTSSSPFFLSSNLENLPSSRTCKNGERGNRKRRRGKAARQNRGAGWRVGGNGGECWGSVRTLARVTSSSPEAELNLNKKYSAWSSMDLSTSS